MTHSPMHIDELVEHWTILDEERELIAGKRGATRLAFVILSPQGPVSDVYDLR